MNTLIHILIFIIVLLVYVHVANQLKTSEDLEIYEFDYTDNTYLQEVCDLKQPAVFPLQPVNPGFYESVNSDVLDELSNCDVKIKESEDYWKEMDSVDYILVPYKSSQTLIKTDTHSNYITENNDSFVEESGLYPAFKTNDELLKPSFSIHSTYDILTGSDKACTPLRYHTHNRYFLSVNSGKIRVKLTPWKSSRYLYPNKDYDSYEFYSPINVWKPQRKYFHEMDKIKYLEFDINVGSVLYVPSYWWYSIQYSNDSTIVCGFTYNTPMNYVANTKDMALYYLQQSNTKTKITKTIELPVHTAEKDIDDANSSENKETIIDNQTDSL